MAANMQPDSGKDLTEKPNPNNYKTFATDNGQGKSLTNVSPSPMNKRGVEPTMAMKDSMGMAHVKPAQEVM